MLPAAALLAIGGTALANAGFTESGQLAFVLLAAMTGLVLAAVDPGLAREAFRTPAVVVLLLLGAITALSAGWSIGESGAALRWGAVIVGYGAMTAAGYAIARRGGPEAVAALVVGVAVATGIVGLIAAGVQEKPYAERIGGSWRPGGPFEYPPALGALQLAALPLGFRWMTSEMPLPILGAMAVTIASASVALISSRAILALGLLLLLAVVVWPRQTIGKGRPLALAATSLALTVGACADAVAGSYDEPYMKSADGWRLIGLALLLLLAPLLWALLRRCFNAEGLLLAGRRSKALGLGVVPLVLAFTAAALTPDTGSGVEPDAGATHGRLEIWGAAVRTAVDDPLQGSGALTFDLASLEEQKGEVTRFAHNLLLEQWVELGVAGLLIGCLLLALVAVIVLRSRGHPSFWLLGPGAAVFLTMALIDWQWHVPAVTAVFALMIGGLSARQPR